MPSFLGPLINGGGSAVVTPDLLKDASKPITNTDYFDIVITDLQPNTSYNVQFAWVYPDDQRSDYSATYTFTTDTESAPAIPSQPTVSAGPGLINVTWNGNNASGTTLQNYAKVNIYVDGVLKDFFLAAGTKSIPLAKGTYSITLRSASSTNVVSNATSPAVSITVTSDSTDGSSALSGLDNKITISANTIVNASKQITDINAGGITVYSSSAGSSTSGNRIVVNSEGIAGFQSGSGDPSFAIKINQWTSPEGIVIPAGSAYFKGTVQSSSGTIGGFSLSSTTLSNTNSTSTIGLYNATQALLGYSGGIKISNTASGRWTSYMVEQGFFVYPSAYDGNNQYSGAFFTDEWRISNSTYGYNSSTGAGMRLRADALADSSTVGRTRLLMNGAAGIVIERSGTSYQVQTSNPNTPLNNKELRNIYVSSTAGEPSPSSPATGDIKLEW